MGKKEVVAAVRSAGLQVAHMAWLVDSAPALPWCVFYLYEDGKFSADDKRYYAHPTWAVELYQRQSDTETETALESAIHASFGDFNKTEVWVESEGCLQTTYTFTETEKGDE